MASVVVGWLILFWKLQIEAAEGTEISPLRFNRDIRPILAEACFSCHGADSASRKGKLRLDSREFALAGGKSGTPAFHPGQPQLSEMVRRIRLNPASDDDAMPPKDSGKTLSSEQKTILERWIAEGALYEKHWAFLLISRPDPPTPSLKAWVRNPIDAFILQGLDEKHLTPSPPASAVSLIRRLALDVTGLPPTWEEVSDFQSAYSEDPQRAWERLIDRYLCSPRYGEHMAVRWLDLARYADTSGFQGDPFRSAWRWRDYVIESFQKNKPFDVFTLEQLAGDLLPGATEEQRLATAFHRNHRFNTEFGAINDEWLLEYAVDRVETTSATWMGLTFGCARCHDHKFDPITQREFYQLLAFFNNIPERGVYWDGADPAFEPSMLAPTPAEAEERKAHLQRIEEKQSDVATWDRSEALHREQRTWELYHQDSIRGALRRILSSAPSNLPSTDGLSPFPFPRGEVLHLPLDGSLEAQFGFRKMQLTNTSVITNLAGGEVPVVITRTELQNTNLNFRNQWMFGVTHPPEFGPGMFSGALHLNPHGEVLRITNALDRSEFSIGFWIKPESRDGILLSKLGKQELFPLGFRLSLTNAHLHLEVYHKAFAFDATMVPVELTSSQELTMGTWHHLALVMDGRRKNRGPTLFLNGQALWIEPLKATARGLNSITNVEPLQVGGDAKSQGAAGWIDDLRIFDRALSSEEISLWARLPQAASLAKPKRDRTLAEELDAAAFYRDFISVTHRTRSRSLDEPRKALEAFDLRLPRVMVMEEKPESPSAYVLFRGQYDAPRERVDAGIPQAFGFLPDGAPTNRLGLARWLISTNHPLTARVVANRLWEQLFGVGLLRNSENFGTQSPPPSHPELLDWLASELHRTHWNVKAVMKTILMSSTYQQSSVVTPEHLQADPDNVWLSRAPRFRLTAEVIRDRALLNSGLLVERVGGPSVVPYLPGEHRQDSPDLHRRSIYSMWQRTRFNPALSVFDAPSRESCILRRPRTNTPMQALALLNEVTFVEASRKAAERILRECPEEGSRIEFATHLILCREPSLEEKKVLESLLIGFRERFAKKPEAVTALLHVGASKCDDSLKPVDVAAFASLASVLMNLDEYVMRD